MNGFHKLYLSAKAWFAAGTLLLCAIVALRGECTPAFAACVSTVGSIFLYTHAQNDRASIEKGMSDGPSS